MTPRQTLLAGAGIAAFVPILLAVVWFSGVRKGHADERASTAKARVDTVEKRVRQVDTVLVKAKASLAKTLTIYDSTRVTDTIPVIVERPSGKPDTVTVYIPRDVADTAVQACLRVVRACQAGLAVRDTLAEALRGQLRAVQAQRPSFLRQALSKGLYFGAGLGIGALVRR